MGNVEIFLVGTVHILNGSCYVVKLLLESVHPNCIFVGLCEAWIPLLDGGKSAKAAVPQEENKNINAMKPLWIEHIAHIQESQAGVNASHLYALAYVCTRDYANMLGIEVDGEFWTTHEYWKAQWLWKLQQEQMYYNTTESYFPMLIFENSLLLLTLVQTLELLTWWPKTLVKL